MVYLTKPQRKSLHRVFVRAANNMADNTVNTALYGPDTSRAAYITFRKTVMPLLAGNGCIMVHWCGMWLGIETDGHTHS